MLIRRLQSMVDQTDVGMEKEDHGPMMSTEYQARHSNVFTECFRVILHAIYIKHDRVCLITFPNTDNFLEMGSNIVSSV